MCIARRENVTNLTAEGSAERHPVLEDMVHGVVVGEQVGGGEEAVGHVMQGYGAHLRHPVELSEVVRTAPFRPSVQVGFREVQVVLSIIQDLSIQDEKRFLHIRNNNPLIYIDEY